MKAAVAFVLWDGLLYGGAETATITLCAALRRRGLDARVVFVGSAGVYERSLVESGVPWIAAGFSEGSAAIAAPRRFTKAVAAGGGDIAVLPQTGFLTPVLRLGGYGGRLVAVEHGGLLQTLGRSPIRRVRESADRILATPLLDAQVAVSDFLLARLRQGPHAATTVRIHNGIDLEAYAAGPRERAMRLSEDPTVVIGCAGKLMRGKGFEDVIEAAARISLDTPWRVEIAGDGYLRSELERAIAVHDMTDRVRLLGWVDDVPAFWAGCDIAIAASNGCVESFGMVVLEAMASGIPAIVSRSGGLPEVLGTDGAGVVFEPGDVSALADALRSFLADEEERERAGEVARARARGLSADVAAGQYADLFEALVPSVGGER